MACTLWTSGVGNVSALIHFGRNTAALIRAKEQAGKANMANAGCTNLEQQNEGGGWPTGC
ncbi:hypothetical protein F4W67_19810 [Pseudomonas caricapapayae]|nr:hypothetical protein F4W67_19810 [Pseudomonas caricapapayae]